MEDLDTQSIDANGIQVLLSADVVDIRFVEVTQDLFANPSEEYTGYAADGFWYTNGVQDPTHTPFQATWAAEGAGAADLNRGTLDRFPDRIFVLTTVLEVVILDAADLSVWMRFRLLETASAGAGTLLGEVGTSLRAADFRNGFLAVATDEGLRIADFQQDRGVHLTSTAATRSLNWADNPTAGLVDRNNDLVLSGAALSASGRTLVSDDCTDVSCTVRSVTQATAKSNVTAAAVGHPSGLTGVRLIFPAQSEPETLEHSGINVIAAAWGAVDDADGDGTTPFVADALPTNWAGAGVLVGDEFVPDTGGSYRITEVGQTSLALAPEIPVASLGAGYTINRPVPRVRALAGGSLVFANGHSAVAQVLSEAWYDGSPVDLFGSTFDASALPNNTGDVNDIEVVGTQRFIASDIGVYFATSDWLAGGGDAELRYTSPASASEGSYPILAGGFVSVSAVVMDPETQQLLIATTENGASVLTEVSPAIQQAFRFFTKTSAVKRLVAYRNPQGPPDLEVG